MSIDDEIKAMTFAQVALMVVGAAAFGILWALATSTAPANCTKYTGPVAGYDYNGSTKAWTDSHGQLIGYAVEEYTTSHCRAVAERVATDLLVVCWDG